jgi:hypothetical protein
MTVITHADSQRMLERAAEARHHAVERVTDYHGTPAEREAMAGSVFRQYSCDLLKDLLRVAATDDKAENAESTDGSTSSSLTSSWVRRRHDEELLELGRELRDSFPEGEARHAVAQVIQRELLEAERRLKFALHPGHPASSDPEGF